MTDNEIIKALECCYGGMGEECGECPNRNTCGNIDVLKSTIDLINRQKAENSNLTSDLTSLKADLTSAKAEIEKFKNRQKPTGASGYKIENGKVVFFTNMLGGYREEKENLEEVVKTLNELLQECYSKDEIAFALKCTTEELKIAKAEAYKEMADILTAKFIHIFRLEESNRRYLKRVVELILRDMGVTVNGIS